VHLWSGPSDHPGMTLITFRKGGGQKLPPFRLRQWGSAVRCLPALQACGKNLAAGDFRPSGRGKEA
jgi:hypothetical protein